MSSATDAFVQSNQPRFLDELKNFLRIPSISTLPEHAADVQRAAQFVADGLKAAGLENRYVVEISIQLIIVEAETDDEMIWNLETPIFHRDLHDAPRVAIEKSAHSQRVWSAAGERLQQVA